ncbi:MAG TPA: hypothetical protein VNY05_06935 [Candidatus Acidoferrales bacterium]|nr:hypothetical protein [Candidatus Acidoferrales bacterium]
MRGHFLLSAAVLALAANRAPAEVVDSASNGFVVRITVNIKAAPDEVYRRIVHNVGDWWNSEHTFSHDSHNLTIEEKATGCFCEKLPNNGGVRHMEVIYLAPGKALILSGALGPLHSIAATGNMTFDLSPADGGTTLVVSYAVHGYLKAGMNTWAAPVDGVLVEQITRLKNYIERGNQAAK